MLEKVASEDSPYRPGNISSFYYSGKQINNKTESVITKIGSKNGRVLTSGGKIKNFTVTRCCNPAAVQFVLPVLIFHGRKKKEDFDDRLTSV
jgi:hypothetical protein